MKLKPLICKYGFLHEYILSFTLSEVCSNRIKVDYPILPIAWWQSIKEALKTHETT